MYKSVLSLPQTKAWNETTLWRAYGATTHCHQDKPGLLSSASLGWQQTSSWLALVARGKPKGSKSGLGMRLKWLWNEATWSGMRLQWCGYGAIVVWVWGYSGVGMSMRLQWCGNEAATVWDWGYSGLGWDYSSLGMRLQLTLFSSVATAFLRSKG